MAHHVDPHQACGRLATVGERTGSILDPGRRPTRFGVAEQHEAEHDAESLSCCNQSKACPVALEFGLVREPCSGVRRNIAANRHSDAWACYPVSLRWLAIR